MIIRSINKFYLYLNFKLNPKLELLAKTVSEAHARTCLCTTEQIVDMMRKPQDTNRILYFKNLVSSALIACFDLHWLVLSLCLTSTTNDCHLIDFDLYLPRIHLKLEHQSHEDLWLECASRLTNVIQQIIEFAKMVPGFMKLSQDDQIVLLKAGQQLITDNQLIAIN